MWDWELEYTIRGIYKGITRETTNKTKQQETEKSRMKRGMEDRRFMTQLETFAGSKPHLYTQADRKICNGQVLIKKT